MKIKLSNDQRSREKKFNKNKTHQTQKNHCVRATDFLFSIELLMYSIRTTK